MKNKVYEIDHETVKQLQQGGIINTKASYQPDKVIFTIETSFWGKTVLENAPKLLDSWVDSTMDPKDMWHFILQIPKMFTVESLMKLHCIACDASAGMPCKTLEGAESIDEHSVHKARIETQLTRFRTVLE